MRSVAADCCRQHGTRWCHTIPFSKIREDETSLTSAKMRGTGKETHGILILERAHADHISLIMGPGAIHHSHIRRYITRKVATEAAETWPRSFPTEKPVDHIPPVGPGQITWVNKQHTMRQRNSHRKLTTIRQRRRSSPGFHQSQARNTSVPHSLSKLRSSISNSCDRTHLGIFHPTCNLIMGLPTRRKGCRL